MPRRPGLLALEKIKEVLDLERTTDLFVRCRHELGASEPELMENLEYWINKELAQLKPKYANLNSDKFMDWVGHLLMRYFIRGWNMYRKAVNADLEDQLGANEES
jgi:hypothetical protein